MAQCKICGEENCKKHTALIGKSVSIESFAGSSPPEIFVGRWNYPNVYAGILSPTEYGETKIMSSPELWHKKKLPIQNILSLREKLIYARSTANVKKPLEETKFLNSFREIAMTHSSIPAEFKLKKPITKQKEQDPRVPLIKNAATAESATLQENPKIKKKVDYLVNDTDVKSKTALLELEKSKISNSSMIKILSAGLLGLQKNRKLVPTRWSITAVDDTISKSKLEKIRYFKTLQEIQLFHSEYLGNHYEFLLLPEIWSYEILEISMRGLGIWQDYETFSPRKKYADSVTGGYYAIRLPITEYLEKIKRQATCIVFREIRPEYYAPLGVGILRQNAREAFTKIPEKFQTVQEALEKMQTRLKSPINIFKDKSYLLKNYKKQKRINEFF